MCDLLSFFFPSFCVGCGALGGYVCSTCFRLIKKNKDESCFYCGKKSPLGLTHVKCRKREGIDGWWVPYKYEASFKRILIGAKYKRAHLILQSLLNHDSPPLYRAIWRWKKVLDPIIVPVPLSAQRMRERGFNQSLIIGEHLASRTGIPIGEILIRIKNTPHLAKMKDRGMRKKAARHAFRFVGAEVPRAVLLVDDVITTGATIGECARSLKRAGVETVLAFSLAK